MLVKGCHVVNNKTNCFVRCTAQSFICAHDSVVIGSVN